ncbi:hypothetical protein L345_04301, partial [Ophiophagus hannah]
MGGGGRDGTPGFCQGKGEYGEITEVPASVVEIPPQKTEEKE